MLRPFLIDQIIVRSQSVRLSLRGTILDNRAYSNPRSYLPQILTFVVKWSFPIYYVPQNSQHVPQQPGIYEILTKLRNDGLKRRYVGFTDNLQRRYDEHLSLEEPNMCIRERVQNKVPYFRYWSDDTISRPDLRDVERALVDRYQYTCNEQRAYTGSGRDVFVRLIEIPPDERLPTPQ
jgi:hypothetical protein